MHGKIVITDEVFKTVLDRLNNNESLYSISKSLGINYYTLYSRFRYTEEFQKQAGMAGDDVNEKKLKNLENLKKARLVRKAKKEALKEVKEVLKEAKKEIKAFINEAPPPKEENVIDEVECLDIVSTSTNKDVQTITESRNVLEEINFLRLENTALKDALRDLVSMRLNESIELLKYADRRKNAKSY